MEEEKLDTKELYGVFCNDGSFKIYHHIIFENVIECLFENKINKNTIMKEEIKLFSPLVVYTPDDDLKIKSQNWLNGEVFTNNEKYYRAIKLDIILNEILHADSPVITESLVDKIENIINTKLENNKDRYNEIWNNILDDKNVKTKRRVKNDK